MPPSTEYSTSSPALSVIIASYKSHRTIERCLASLIAQTTEHPFEIILVDSTEDESVKRISERFVAVRLIRSSGRLYPGSARNLGIKTAKAPVIAFVDADCTVPSGWVDLVLSAQARPGWQAIGGAVENDPAAGATAWASYFCEFSHWMPCGGSREMPDIAGASMTYKRMVFDQYGVFIDNTYCSDSEYHWRLARNGLTLLFDPSIRVVHASIDSLPQYVVHEFAHGCFFAQVRHRFGGFPKWRCLIYAALFPLLFLSVWVRTVSNVLACKPYRSFLWKSILALTLGIAAWCAGEAAGYMKNCFAGSVQPSKSPQ